MNKNLKLRKYTGEKNLHIDGRNIPYQLVTVADYLYAKNEDWEKADLEKFIEENKTLYLRINQIIALKQACVLFRNTSHSCGSLSEDLFSLKYELITEVKRKFGYEFDEQLMESYPSEEEYNRLR